MNEREFDDFYTASFQRISGQLYAMIDSTSNEGGAGSDRDAQVEAQIQEQITGSAEVVTAMCLFTEAGCPKSR